MNIYSQIKVCFLTGNFYCTAVTALNTLDAILAHCNLVCGVLMIVREVTLILSLFFSFPLFLSRLLWHLNLHAQNEVLFNHATAEALSLPLSFPPLMSREPAELRLLA